MPESKSKIGVFFVLVVFLLAAGSLSFHYLENWSFVDSFYFTTSTLLTIGYGDLVPSNPVSKVATVVFALLGVSVFLYGLTVITSYYIQKGQQFEEYEARKIKDIVSNIGLPFRKHKPRK